MCSECYDLTHDPDYQQVPGLNKGHTLSQEATAVLAPTKDEFATGMRHVWDVTSGESDKEKQRKPPRGWS